MTTLFSLLEFQQVEQEMVGDALEELRAKFKNGKKKRKKPGRIRPSTLTEVWLYVMAVFLLHML